MLKTMVLFGLAGVGCECCYVGVMTWWRNRGNILRPRFLYGYSSVLFVPLYALAPLLIPLIRDLGWAWYWRAVAYTACIYAVEGSFNSLYRWYFGQSPSEESYRQSRLHFKALVDFTKAPFWGGLGMLLEWLV